MQLAAIKYFAERCAGIPENIQEQWEKEIKEAEWSRKLDWKVMDIMKTCHVQSSNSATMGASMAATHSNGLSSWIELGLEIEEQQLSTSPQIFAFMTDSKFNRIVMQDHVRRYTMEPRDEEFNKIEQECLILRGQIDRFCLLQSESVGAIPTMTLQPDETPAEFDFDTTNAGASIPPTAAAAGYLPENRAARDRRASAETTPAARAMRSAVAVASSAAAAVPKHPSSNLKEDKLLAVFGLPAVEVGDKGIHSGYGASLSWGDMSGGNSEYSGQPSISGSYSEP
ncbi:hypothetical protein C0991_009335, partial [Blastosporella zonata]